jgi:hypothetical protein
MKAPYIMIAFTEIHQNEGSTDMCTQIAIKSESNAFNKLHIKLNQRIQPLVPKEQNTIINIVFNLSA